MGNLCSIFHSRFKNLIKVIPSARKAQLMDYILLGWQTSTYKLKRSDQKWFMKHYDEIIEDTGIQRSTLGRYIKELADEGLIVRRRARYSRTNEAGDFEVKTGTYIHPTEKLLNFLKPTKEKQLPKQEDTHNEIKEHSEDNNSNKEVSNTDSSNIGNNERTGSLKMRELYIRDLYPSFLINTISLKKLSLSVDKQTFKRLVCQYESIQKFFETEIKEEIPDEVKKLVLGTFFNLTFEHKKQFSMPTQIAAEYLYALINVDFYMPHAMCFKHRNNILSKIMRENRWRTPKGFYNHFYLGQNFKDKQELREKRRQEEKENEMSKSDYYFENEHQDERLIALEEKMNEKVALINELQQSLYTQPDEEFVLHIREKINALKQELEKLWQQQYELEQEIEKESCLENTRLCA